MRSLLLAAMMAGVAKAKTAPAAPVVPTLLYEFVGVNYTFANASEMNKAISSGSFKPENNIITGIKFDAAGNCYVTVPRWRTGVPSTLNKIVLDSNGNPVLQPFPSWEMNALRNDNPSGLKYLQSMEISPDQIMWMLDVGRLYIFDPTVAPDNSSPPKLVLYDLNANKTVQTFIFPDDVAPWTSSFLNDVVVDQAGGWAYISDAGGDGGIIAYSRAANNARRFSDKTTAADPSVVISVNGVIYPGISTPVDGIALDPSTKRLHYCALRGETLFSIPTSALQDFTMTTDQLSALVVNHGYKPPSDGMTFSSLSTLYFGALTEDTAYQWQEGSSLKTQSIIVPVNTTTLQWQDTFAFAGPGLLAFTTNKLQRYIVQTMEFSGADGANMRIFTVPIAGDSYMAGMGPYSPPSPNNGNNNGNNAGQKTAVAVLSVFLVISLIALLALLIVVDRSSGWSCCLALRDRRGRPGSGLRAADAVVVEDGFY